MYHRIFVLAGCLLSLGRAISEEPKLFDDDDTVDDDRAPEIQNKLTLTNTGRFVAGLRAIDSQDENNQFSDPLAHILAGEESMTLVAQSKETIHKSLKGGKRPRNDITSVLLAKSR